MRCAALENEPLDRALHMALALSLELLGNPLDRDAAECGTVVSFSSSSSNKRSEKVKRNWKDKQGKMKILLRGRARWGSSDGEMNNKLKSAGHHHPTAASPAASRGSSMAMIVK